MHTSQRKIRNHSSARKPFRYRTHMHPPDQQRRRFFPATRMCITLLSRCTARPRIYSTSPNRKPAARQLRGHTHTQIRAVETFIAALDSWLAVSWPYSPGSVAQQQQLYYLIIFLTISWRDYQRELLSIPLLGPRLSNEPCFTVKMCVMAILNPLLFALCIK